MDNKTKSKIAEQLKLVWPSFFTTCRKTGDWSKVQSAHPLIWGDASNIRGNVENLIGDVSEIRGDVSRIHGHLQFESHPGIVVYTYHMGRIPGGTSDETNNGIWGNVSKIRGDVTGLIGNVSRLRGDVSEIYGEIDEELRGNVSGIRGDITWITGDLTRIKANTLDILTALLQG